MLEADSVTMEIFMFPKHITKRNIFGKHCRLQTPLLMEGHQTHKEKQ